jgi:purine nucleosidase
MRESADGTGDDGTEFQPQNRVVDATAHIHRPTNRRGRRSSSASLVLLMLCICTASIAAAAPRQVIIDTDPGADDAIAIMLALNSPELAVRALTIVAGNVPSAQGLDNALRLVSLARRCDLPVAVGAQRPLVRILTTAEMFHGKNGLGDVQIPPATCAVDKRWAPDLIIDLVHGTPHDITLVTIGPLTNIALAVIKDPTIVPLVKEVIMMGGSICGGNSTPVSEFNVYVDPEAAKIVFEAGWRVTMIGLEMGEKSLLTRKHLELLAHEPRPMSRLVVDIGTFLVARAERFGNAGAAMYDPLAIAVAIDPTLVKVTPMRVDVETAGTITRGETVTNRSGVVHAHELRAFPDGERYVATGAQPITPNANVATTVDADRFAKLLLSKMKGN